MTAPRPFTPDSLSAPRTRLGLLIIGPANLHERWHPDGGPCLVADASPAGLDAIIAARKEAP